MRKHAGLAASMSCFLASIVLAAPVAHAACADTGLSTLAGRADGVFVGTVLRADAGVAEVRVSDVYRGDPAAVVRVDGGTPDEDDASAFSPGDQYLVLASGGGSTWRTTSCAGSGPVSDARLSTVEKVLGPATARRDAGQPAPTASASPSESAGTKAATGEVAAASSGNGPKIVVGVIVVALLVGSFFLPRLRRRHRRRD